MPKLVEFADERYPSVELKEDASLSEVLTIQNSPILFGCRIGICGTCSVEVEDLDGCLHERTPVEEEFLETMAPGRKNVRLACQININSDIRIKKTEL